MTKRDLAVEISKSVKLSQQDVREVVQKTLDHIRYALAEGERIELRDFGVFEVRKREARIGRNPNNPEKDVRIPPQSVVRFKPGKGMKDQLQEWALKGGGKQFLNPEV